MKKVMWLMLVVVFAGISLQGQERKRRPEASRKPEHFRKAEVSRKPEYNREYEAKMKKEFHEMGIEKRELEFEAYISELEFENEMREIELERARLEIQEAEKNSSCNSSCGKWKGGKCRPGKSYRGYCFLSYVYDDDRSDPHSAYYMGLY